MSRGLYEEMTLTSTLSSDWEVEEERCVRCGDCIVICPVGALKMRRGIPFMADKVSCCGRSCRICEYHCQTGAIKAYEGKRDGTRNC